MDSEQNKTVFKCQQCGACCRWPGNVLLTDADVSRLASAMQLSEEELIRNYTELAGNRRQLTLTERADGSCVLLEGSACRFYEARPEQCRIYPEGWKDTSGCPAMDQTEDD